MQVGEDIMKGNNWADMKEGSHCVCDLEEQPSPLELKLETNLSPPTLPSDPLATLPSWSSVSCLPSTNRSRVITDSVKCMKKNE